MNLPLNQIQADPNNPRKKFDIVRLNELKESIKVRGIKMPLIVEKIAKDKYQLIDGERRYRVAKELGLKEVPAVVEETANAIDRLITQFHIQEQHENWSGTEKAAAILKLAEESKMDLKQLCESLSISSRVIRTYLGFARLANRESFLDANIPVDYAQTILGIKAAAKKLTEEVLNKPFNTSDDRALENNLVRRLKDGEFATRHDLVKLKDSFTKDPKSIKKLIEDKNTTGNDLYISTGARGAYELRQVFNSARYLHYHGESFLKKKDVKINSQIVQRLKYTQETIRKLLDLAE